MTKLIHNEEFNLYELSGRAVYSSRQVAEEFKKLHKNVLQSYDEMLATAVEDYEDGIAGLKSQPSSKEQKVSLRFMKENFMESKYKDASGKMSREVLMTKNGSSVLVMGFTGKKALAFKIELMNRFDRMEEFIYSLKSAKSEYPALTAALKEYKKDPKPHHFINEADMINRIVLGMSAKQFKDANSITDKQSIRPYLSTEQIKGIEELQRADIGLLIAEIPFDQRKQILTQHLQRMNVKKIAA